MIRRADLAVLQAAQRVGNLPWAMQEMADSARRRFIYRLQAIVQAVFPAVVICFGLMVMFIVVALFLPLVTLIQRMAMKMVRRGMTLLELAVAGALLGTLMVVCLQLLAATAEQRRAADQRQLAILEVENAMERLAARPWAELTPEAVAAPQLSPSIRNRLPGAELKVEVTDAVGRAACQANRRFASLAGPRRPVHAAGEDRDVAMEERMRNEMSE